MLRRWLNRIRGRYQHLPGQEFVSAGEDARAGRHRVCYSRAGGLGDELMALGVMQAAFRIHPDWEASFLTRHSEVLDGAAGDTFRIEPFEETRIDGDCFTFTYQAKHAEPLMVQMAHQLDIRPSEYPIHLDESRFTGVDRRAEGPRVVVQPGSSAWTSNKQWPSEFWHELISSLDPSIEVVEVGTEPFLDQQRLVRGINSVAGETHVQEYASWIRSADAFVGPPSSGIHLAHAFRVPSVVIVGGYEAPNYPYPLADQLGTEVECAPCWLREPCPVGWSCLKGISPGLVRVAVERALA